MSRFTKKKVLAVGAASIILAGTAGVAFAYWTSTGDGTGTSTTGSATPWTVTVDSTTLGDLTPGGPTDSVKFHVTNPGTGSQNLAATTAVVTTNKAGCDATDFAVGTPAITYGQVAAGATVNGTISLQMINKSTNQDNCQNAVVTVAVHAS